MSEQRPWIPPPLKRGPFETTMSSSLHSYVLNLVKLPAELSDKILIRLPISLILELSLVEDKIHPPKSIQQMGNGVLSWRIIGNIAWKNVIHDRMNLLKLRELFETIIEAYNIIYQRPFNHACREKAQSRRRIKNGMNENNFVQLRRLLSLHTREGGPGPHRQELFDIRRLLYDEYHELAKLVWTTMRKSYDSFLRDGTFHRATAPRHLPNGIYVENTWHQSWVSRCDSLEVRHWKLRFMVSMDRYFRQKQGDELKTMASLLEKHPELLMKHGDSGQEPRPNIDHITKRMLQDAERLGNIKFAVRHRIGLGPQSSSYWPSFRFELMNRRDNGPRWRAMYEAPNLHGFYEGESWFNTPCLALRPLDKCMWFFLDCRAQTNLEALPPTVVMDARTVDSRLLYFDRTIDRGRYIQYLPRLLRNSRETEFVGRLPYFSDRDGMLLNTYQRALQDGVQRRPVFTDAVKKWNQEGKARNTHPYLDQKGIKPPPVFAFQEQTLRLVKGSEHLMEDIKWLEAFLRCCEYFRQKHPGTWTKINNEAARKHPLDCEPCRKAEQRKKST